MKKTVITSVAAVLIAGNAFGQMRSYDKNGLNVFETPKVEPAKFDGVKVKIGGAFTQSWQALTDENTATPNYKWDGAAYEYNTSASKNTTITINDVVYKTMVNGATYNNVNKLTPIKPGFNTANANLFFDVQLAEGVNLNLALYLSSRHHNETWVKGGYIQFDKLPFFKSNLLDNIMKFTTLKVGHMEVNYGDAHFRRSDNGNSIYNPFVENYIMDGFATEIGAEADFQHNGLLGVVSVTNGEIKGDITDIDIARDSMSNGRRNPVFIGKLGYDKQITDKFRLRVTGSGYYAAGSFSNTLYGGDRGGSHYFGVMENAISTSAAFSGRFNPGFTDKIGSLMGNLFLKYGGLESFTTIESSKGRNTKETTERTASQFASDLVFRFGKSEIFWIGARYNKVNSELLSVITPTQGPIKKTIYDVNIDRLAFSAGWFATKNIMTKIEYVNQNYNGFKDAIYDEFVTTKVLAPADIRHGGKFNGIVFEAVVGF